MPFSTEDKRAPGRDTIALLTVLRNAKFHTADPQACQRIDRFESNRLLWAIVCIARVTSFAELTGHRN